MLSRVLVGLRRQSGNTLIEMALVLPMVFLMTFGLIDFALVLFGMGNVNFASRAALRYATLHSATSYSPTTQADLNRIISPYVFRYPSNTYAINSAYYNANTVGSGICITVSITYKFNAFGHVYSGIGYSSTGCGAIQQ